MSKIKFLTSNTYTFRVGSTRLVWDSIESESEMKKGIIEARILTGVYMLQVNRHLFSGGSIEPTCQLCWLKENIYHLATRCPVYHEVRVATVQQLKLLVVEQSSSEVWSTYFKDCSFILRVFICPDYVNPTVPGLSTSLTDIEALSRTFFYKIHVKRMRLLKQLE